MRSASQPLLHRRKSAKVKRWLCFRFGDRRGSQQTDVVPTADSQKQLGISVDRALGLSRKWGVTDSVTFAPAI